MSSVFIRKTIFVRLLLFKVHRYGTLLDRSPSHPNSIVMVKSRFHLCVSLLCAWYCYGLASLLSWRWSQSFFIRFIFNIGLAHRALLFFLVASYKLWNHSAIQMDIWMRFTLSVICSITRSSCCFFFFLILLAENANRQESKYEREQQQQQIKIN